MKRLIKHKLTHLFLLAALILISNLSFGQNSSAIASSYFEDVGRCTGSSYCTACTNCSRCKHCNGGGSCGVCSGGSRRKRSRSTSTRSNNYYYSTSKSTPYSDQNWTLNSNTSNSTNSIYSSEIYYLPNDPFSEYYLKTLMVNTLSLNLRKGPSTDYEIIGELTKYQELVFYAMTGDWIKVKVKSTNIIGYVHYNYIVVLTE